jgi:hypothetical protein
VAVLLAVPLVNVLATALTEAGSRPALAAPIGSVRAFLAVALLQGTQGPVEELGWPSYALPLLQRRCISEPRPARRVPLVALNHIDMSSAPLRHLS